MHELPPDGPVLTAYAKAVAAMKRLDQDSPNDGRGWRKQAEIHNMRCTHQNWWFLPWHRVYEAKFEALIRHYSEDESFALPYWDWTANPTLPAVFLDPQSPLYHPRAVGAGAAPRRNRVDEAALVRAYGAEAGFTTFGGGPSPNQTDETGGAGGLEGGPHNFVHGWLGYDPATGNGFDMGNYMSPLDPIFWLHHCNIDRHWESWTAVQTKNGVPNGGDPSEPAWSSHVCKVVDGDRPAPPEYAQGDFTERDGTRVAPILADVRTTKSLGYRFDKLYSPPDTRPALISGLPADLRLRAFGAVAATPDLPVGIRSRLPQPLTANFAGPEAASTQRSLSARVVSDTPIPLGASVRVFVNCGYLTPETPESDPHFVTAISGFGASHHHDEDLGGFRAIVDLTPALARIGEQDAAAVSSINVQFVLEDQNEGAGRIYRPVRVDLMTA
ncbi:tyrosinase family protein [Dongia sp. agr-C8]